MKNILLLSLNGEPINCYYQWDSEQTIVLDGVGADCKTNVHFCNIDSDKAIVVSPSIQDGRIIVKIPNILLQRSKPVVIYLYQTDDDVGNKTIWSSRIPVIPRPKPESYCYTETETLLYETLDTRVKNLEAQSSKSDPYILNGGNFSPYVEGFDFEKVRYEGERGNLHFNCAVEAETAYILPFVRYDIVGQAFIFSGSIGDGHTLIVTVDGFGNCSYTFFEGGRVRSVNGVEPDDNGNVSVNSTCDLKQPRWGGEIKEIARITHDSVNGFYKPMSSEEYDDLMSRYETVILLCADGSVIEDFDISAAKHEKCNLPSFDPEADVFPCFVLRDDDLGDLWEEGKLGANAAIVFMGREITPIPKEYIEPHIKSVNGVRADENGNVEIEVGGGSVELDTTLTESGKAADAAAVGEALAVIEYTDATDDGTGIVTLGRTVQTGGSAEGAVLYTEQTLTEEQQAQARANIGAFGSKQSADNAGALLYVGADGNVTNVAVGDGIAVNFGPGKNIAREEWSNGYWSPTGWKEDTISTCGLREKVSVIPGATYTASMAALGNITEDNIFMYIYEYDEDGNFLVENTQVKGKYFSPTRPRTFGVGVNTAYIGVRLYCRGYSYENIIPSDFMIEAGSVDTEYEPYTEGYTMTVQKQTAESITDLAYAEHAPSATVRSIAHRGVTINAPDCTAPAYILARKAGFMVAENDVQLTSDGKYVMWHDVTLAKCAIVYSLDGKSLYEDSDGNRYWVTASSVYEYDDSTGEYTLTDVEVSTLTRVNGNTITVAEQTYGFLRNIDVGSWKSGKYTGTQMLSFEEWIDLCKMLGMECYIDAKFTFTEEQAAELVSIVRKKGMLRKCSWLGSNMLNIRKADPKARCGILQAPTESKFVENGVYDKALKEGGEGSVFWNPRNTDVTAENVELTLSYGYGYESWYVGTANLSEEVYYAEIERLLKCGCQGLTLDDRTVEHFTNYKYGNAMKN